MPVEVLIEDRNWATAGLEALARRAVAATLAHLGLGNACEISVLGCSDTRIAVLNEGFRGKPQPTNVLSWPSDERGAARAGERPRVLKPQDAELGDIAIAYGTCKREADAAGVAFDAHVLHLVVHGTLHLLGYDHERDADAALMEAIETDILGRMGIADPYGRDAQARL